MPNIDKDEGSRSFAHTLQQLGDGTFHAECSEKFHAFLKTLSSHADDVSKAKGTFTITLGVLVEDNVVTIDPDLKVKEPKPLRRRGRFWLTAGHNLTPENPKQQKLPLTEVPAPKTRTVEIPEQPVRNL